MKRLAALPIVAFVLLLAGMGVASAQETHTVVRGDTLWALSQRYHTTVQALATNTHTDASHADIIRSSRPSPLNRAIDVIVNAHPSIEHTVQGRKYCRVLPTRLSWSLFKPTTLGPWP